MFPLNESILRKLKVSWPVGCPMRCRTAVMWAVFSSQVKSKECQPHTTNVLSWCWAFSLLGTKNCFVVISQTLSSAVPANEARKLEEEVYSMHSWDQKVYKVMHTMGKAALLLKRGKTLNQATQADVGRWHLNFSLSLPAGPTNLTKSEKIEGGSKLRCPHLALTLDHDQQIINVIIISLGLTRRVCKVKTWSALRY